MGFNGAKDDGVHGIFHETTEQDKGREFTLGGFRSPPLVDVEDMEVSLL